jgi:hypothetical protein
MGQTGLQPGALGAEAPGGEPAAAVSLPPDLDLRGPRALPLIPLLAATHFRLHFVFQSLYHSQSEA